MADNLTPQAASFFSSLQPPSGGSTLTAAVPSIPRTGPAYASVDNHAYDTIEEKTGKFLAMGAPAAAVGAVDSLLSSLGLVDDERIGNYLATNYGSFGDYYQNNKEVAQGIGGAVGMLIPGMAATKLASGTGILAKGIQFLGEDSLVGNALSKILTSGKTYDELLAGTRARAAAIAEQGVTDFTTDTRLASMRNTIGMTGAATDSAEIANLTALGVENRAALSPLTTLALDRLKEGVAFDIGAYTFFNHNEMLYPSDQSYADMFAMNLGIVGAFVAPEMVFMNRAITRAVQDASPIAFRALNPADRELGNILYRDGTRDLGITQTAQVVQDLDNLENTTSLTPLYKTSINRQKLSLQNEISDQLDKLGTETEAWGMKGLTDKATFDQGHKGTVFDALESNPVQLLGAKAVDTVAPDMISHIDNVVTRPADLKVALEAKLDLHEENAALYEMRRNDLKDPTGPAGTKLTKMIADAKDAMDETKQQLEALKQSEWFVLDPNQGVLLADRAKTKYNYDPTNNKVFKSPRSENEAALYYTPDGRNAVTGERMFKQGFSETGFFNSTKLNTEFGDLGFYERSAVFNSVNRAIKEYNPGNAPEFNFGKSDGWLRFDYALSLEEKNPGLLQKATFPQEWMGIDRKAQLEWASLQSKYEDWSKMQDVYEGQMSSNFKVKPSQLLTPEDIRYQLNLPNQPLGQVGPIEEVFHALRIEGQEKLTDAFKSFDDFKQAMQAVGDTKYTDPLPYTQINPDIRGNSFGLATTKMPGGSAEVVNKPVLLVKQPMKMQDQGKDAIETALAVVKAQTLTDLGQASRKGANYVGAIVDFLNGSGATNQVRNLDQLTNGQTGSATFVTQMFNARTNPTLEAALTVSQNVDQIAGAAKQGFFTPHRDTLTKLLDPNNVGDLYEFNLATQARQFRWDLKDDGKHVQAIPSGQDSQGNPINRYGYVLADTPANRAKLQQYFGEDFKDGMLMPSMLPGETYKPLSIGENAHQGMMAVSDIGSKILNETNFLKGVLGKNQTRKIPLWTVPMDLTRPNTTIGYILRGDGNLKTTISGDTAAELQLKVAKEFEAMSPEERDVSRFVTQKDVAANADLHDQVFGNLLDFSDPVAQTGRATGSTGLRIVDRTDTTLKNAINALDDQLDRLTARTRVTYFESELNRVRQMADASGASTGSGNPNVWQQFTNAIEGRSDYSARTPTGQIYTKIESQYDKTLNGLYARYQTDLAYPRANDPEVKANIAAFKKVGEQLGPFNPWDDVQDFLKSTYKGAAPPTMRSNANFLTSFTSTAVLRFLEVGQSLNDAFSLASTLPVVLGAVKRIPGEDLATWSARVGAYATPLTDDVAIPSAGKILASTLHARLNDPEFIAAMGRAKDKGYFTERANDALDVFSVKGDSFVPNLLKKGWDAANYLTDKSFETSRAIAFGAGYKLGKDGFGLSNEADLFTFAKKVADDTIGNYTARNKPQVFQGALGMPLGLFQTFTVNYMQRLLGYVENKQYKNLAMQMGLQTAIFGGRTVPGMDQFVNYYASSHDGRNNPVDYMNAHYGPELTDLIMYGTLSNIPKIWGDQGIAFYQRGDANVRVPGSILDYEKSAPWQLGKQVYGGIAAVADMFRSQFSAQQTAEIVSRYAVNRPIRHLAELAAGTVTDSRGAVITNDVYNGMSIASRILGYRPLVEAKEAEMMNRIHVTEQSQQAKMARLEQSFRSSFRGNSVDGQAMAQGLRDYVDAGGNPKEIGSFIRNQYMISTLPRSERAFLGALSDPTKMYDTIRMINSGLADTQK